MLATIGLTGDPMASSLVCSKNWSWNRKLVLFRQNPVSSVMLLTDMMVLFGSSVTCSNLFLIISNADAAETAVKKAVTS